MSALHARPGRRKGWLWAALAAVLLGAGALVFLLLGQRPAVKFISREGMFAGVPPCSVVGAREAKAAGYDSIRVSVQRTADGVWVRSHDGSINDQARLPDGSELPETGVIAEHGYEELNGYDYGIRYGEAYAGLGLTRAEDFLAVTKELEMEVLLEVKAEVDEAAADDLCALVARAGYGEDIWFSAFSQEPLLLFQERLPKANLAAIDIFGEEALEKILTGGLVSKDHRTRLDCFRTDSFDEELIREYHRKGIEIKVGSAYTEEEIRQFAALGIDTIEVGMVRQPQQALQ